MCLFCEKLRQSEEIIYQNEYVYVIYDAFPVTKGHCLIIPKRHIETYFEASYFEVNAIDEALRYMNKILDLEYKPDGYNIGINCGEVAGQTIMHLHIHLIPRYKNDCENPKGGIRGVIPEKQNY